MAGETELVLMDKGRVMRALKRMAYQIAEDNRDNLDICLVGIKQRGFIIAGLLGSYLSEIYGKKLPVINIHLNEQESEDQLSRDRLGNAYTLVVDDVIFSGETMFTALKRIFDKVTLSEVHSAVLVDRGHRKFPIQAQFTGLEFPTKLNEHVAVITQNDTIEKVVVGTS